MATGHEDLDQFCADESAGSGDECVARASPAMWPVWSASETGTTDRPAQDSYHARTGPAVR